MSNREPRLGPCVYRALDGVSDYTAIITKIDKFEVCLISWLPNIATPQLLTKIRFDPQATPQTAKPGTAYQW